MLSYGFTIYFRRKTILLEAQNLKLRKSKIADILTTYTFDQYQ